MNNEDRIKPYNLITDKYEVSADEIEKEFGVNVGRQINIMTEGNNNTLSSSVSSSHDRRIMPDDEYYRRYGRGTRKPSSKFSNGNGIKIGGHPFPEALKNSLEN